MPDLRAVIFDMHGVLIDSEPIATRLISDILSEQGIQISSPNFDDYKGMTGNEFWSTLKSKYNLTGSIAEYRERMAAEICMYGPELAAPGSRECLERLWSSGLKLALGTSSSRLRMDTVLNLLDLRSFFLAAVSGDDVTRGKPDPMIFQQAAERLGIKPAHCLVIEDSEKGVAAARSAGMSVVGYTGLGASPESLSEADDIVDSFEGLGDETLREIHVAAR